MKTYLTFFFLLILTTTISQTKNDITIKEIKRDNKKSSGIAYSQVSASFFDKDTKQRLLAIIRIDNVGFSMTDTLTSEFYLKKGNHIIQFGSLGYDYSRKMNLNCDLNKDYEIFVYLKAQKNRLD